MDILPQYEGVVVHDHWKPYNQYKNCTHSYCNAHILRELNGITENENTLWCEDMHTLLINMNKAVHKAKKDAKEALSKAQIEKFTLHYEKIIKKCFEILSASG